MQPLVSPLSSTLGTVQPPAALPRAPIGPAEPAFSLPEAFLALQTWLFECEPPDSEPASLVRRKIGGVLGLELVASLFATPLRLASETTPCPFEVVPFGTLRDGARLGWAVLAPELPAERDYPCVSVPPFHGGVAGWFADDSRGALEALLVKEAREAARWSHEPVSPLEDPRWSELCRGIGLSPNLDAPPRSHPLRVHVPDGYRYEPAADGVGVLAPRWAFASDVPRLDHRSAHATLDLTIRAYLGAGFPGTALSICKAAMAGAELDPTFVEAMRGAYIALGRPLHALRADAWLRENGLQRSATSYQPENLSHQPRAPGVTRGPFGPRTNEGRWRSGRPDRCSRETRRPRSVASTGALSRAAPNASTVRRRARRGQGRTLHERRGRRRNEGGRGRAALKTEKRNGPGPLSGPGPSRVGPKTDDRQPTPEKDRPPTADR